MVSIIMLRIFRASQAFDIRLSDIRKSLRRCELKIMRPRNSISHGKTSIKGPISRTLHSSFDSRYQKLTKRAPVIYNMNPDGPLLCMLNTIP